MYREIAGFAYESFLREGAGLVVVREGDFVRHPDGSVEAPLEYLPMGEGESVELGKSVESGKSVELGVRASMPEAVSAYDPRRECVFGMVDASENWTIVTLTAGKLGATPEAILGDRLSRELGIPFLPGSLLRMGEEIGENEPGYCVFLYPDGTEMVMQRVVDDEAGGFVLTDERYRVHVDYLSVFVDTKIRFG